MSSGNGTRFNPASVAINGQSLYRKVNAFIYDDVAKAIEPDGTIDAEMTGPFQIDVAENGATWSNGTDTWVVSEDGCSCHG